MALSMGRFFITRLSLLICLGDSAGTGYCPCDMPRPDSPYNYLYIHSVWILYTNCIYDVHFLYIRIDVYKMYTKWLYTKCVPIFHKLLYTKCIYTKCLYTKHILQFDKYLYTFCIQNLAGIPPLILYTKCIQKFVEMWYTFCIHQLHTSCTIFVYKMSTQFLCGIFPILDRNILIPYRMFLSIIWIVGTIKKWLTVVSWKLWF